jgi:hypothetical protein
MLKIIFSLIMSIAVLFAQDVSFKSTEDKTILVELYSSEGCSSCPPAENWLNGLKNNPELFRKFIPLAFHVSYWNRLGWKDSFSKSSFDDRQRNYQRYGNTTSTYTPQFVVDAQEWRGWFDAEPLPLKEQKSGILHASIHRETVTIDYSNAHETYTVHSALLGFGLSNNITTGENGGRVLEHDFVVLEHKSEPFTKGSITSTKLHSPTHAKRYAYVVWISEPNSSTIVQATGGWLN